MKVIHASHESHRWAKNLSGVRFELSALQRCNRRPVDGEGSTRTLGATPTGSGVLTLVSKTTNVENHKMAAKTKTNYWDVQVRVKFYNEPLTAQSMWVTVKGGDAGEAKQNAERFCRKLEDMNDECNAYVYRVQFSGQSV
jgi:hypothetical protein